MIFHFTAPHARVSKYISLKSHMVLVCYLVHLINCLYLCFETCLVQFHGLCSSPSCLPAFCSPFHLPSQSVIPSLVQQELWIFCACANWVRRMLPCISLWSSSAKPPVNTVHWGRFHLRTWLDLSGQKIIVWTYCWFMFCFSGFTGFANWLTI